MTQEEPVKAPPKICHCKYCHKEFKHLTDKKRHEEEKCAIYGGDVDKRKKKLFQQALEGSRRLDGTEIHTSAIFHALEALPKEQRKSITIEKVESAVVVLPVIDSPNEQALEMDDNKKEDEIIQEIVPLTSNTVTEKTAQKVIHQHQYNLQINNNIQNTKIVNNNNFTQDKLKELCENASNFDNESKELNKVIHVFRKDDKGKPEQVKTFLKKEVLTFDEVKETIRFDEENSRIGNAINEFIKSTLLATRNTMDMDDDGNVQDNNEIEISPSECIWLFYRKVFLPVNPSGKILTKQLARRNTKLDAKGRCEVLAFHKLDGIEDLEHVVWDQRQWIPVLKDLIFVIGNRISEVEKVTKLSTGNKCHPFGTWWSRIKTAEDLQRDKIGQKLIKRITNEMVSDCKDSLIVGWHKLIESCGRLHFDSISATLVGLKALELKDVEENTEESEERFEEAYNLVKEEVNKLRASNQIVPDALWKHYSRLSDKRVERDTDHVEEREKLKINLLVD